MQFRFTRNDVWGYPDGLEEAFNRHLREQGIRIVASNEQGDEIYVEPSYNLVGKSNQVWCIADNGGELNVCKVNHDETLVSIACTPHPRTKTLPAMPVDADTYALILVARIIAALRGQPIDYTWRPFAEKESL